MISQIKYDDIPNIEFEGYEIKKYISYNNTLWRKEPQDQKYYYVLSIDGVEFYIESYKNDVSFEEAYKIYEQDKSFYTIFKSIDELINETIESGTYIDDKMRAGWVYFNNKI
jgi:hypothetical protein